MQYALTWLGLLGLMAAGDANAADVGKSSAHAADSRLLFCCKADNDLFRAVSQTGIAFAREDSPRAAVDKAPPGSGVLILADGYPDKTTIIDAAVFQQAAAKRLRLYVEYPAALPGLAVGSPRGTKTERAVVASARFGQDLPPLSILAVNGLRFVPVEADGAHLVAARVAGFDRAVFGLPKQTAPLLFEHPQGNILVATTQLSRFVTGRYAPQDAWHAVWRGVLSWLLPGRKVPDLSWTPAVRQSYGRDEPLPADAEHEALRRGAEWFIRSKLLLPPSRLRNKEPSLRAAGGLVGFYPSGLAPTPPPEAPVGDGSLGILEAPLSVIQPDGSQLQGVARRGDCNGESAMALAIAGKLLHNRDKQRIARNLLDFWYFTSDACKRERGDPRHGAYGLVAWGIDTPSWYTANYGDDNARLMLGTLTAAAMLQEDRWDGPVMRCLLANLRTTGRLGFRGDRIDLPALAARGWQPYFRRSIVSYSPHMESYLWACFLWAYQQTGFAPFYERPACAIRMTMAQYTDGWHWTNGLAQEKARMLLPLAWLVRVKDTAEHRAWLRKAVDGLVALQQPCGAIREELGLPGHGMCPPPGSNEAYGTAEASLLQQNGDPVSDLLYTTNFALLGLHEAAAVGDPAAAAAEDKLAKFLCRIQVRSEAQPSLDGGWFRAFDYRRWEPWGSNADAGWGAWAIESGWTQSWITVVLGLRQMHTSLWELTRQSNVKRHFDRLRPEMLPDEELQKQQPQTLRHGALHKAVTLAVAPDPRYPGGGAAALTDGRLGSEAYDAPEWLGFEGRDLDATIDLGGVRTIGSVALGSLQDTRLGIYLPVKVAISTSLDGKTFDPVATVAPALSRRERGPLRQTLAAEGLAACGRYVRVLASNVGTIPPGQRAAGAKAWLFADEISVNEAAETPKPPPPKAPLSLTLIPPSPVTDQIVLDIRGALGNESAADRKYQLAVYLDDPQPNKRLHEERVDAAPRSAAGFRFRWPVTGHTGHHRLILVAESGGRQWHTERPLEIVASDVRSTRRLGGAWVDLYHHDPREGTPFNAELAKMTDDDWRQLVRAMHAVDQNIIVISMMFQNFTHRGRHHIESEGYRGRAYYPSKLYAGRMPIASHDPLEVILTEADKLDMQVLPGVGCYAFFDYGPGALGWCERVADELWSRYGHHPSFYGWYLSAEKDGSLGHAEERREIVDFFRQFTRHARRLAPDKPVMLAPNCYHLRGAEPAYRQLLPHLDILCPFAFHRMPGGDLSGEEAAKLLQSLCDESGCHLWMDVESFVFGRDGGLYPRPIAGLVSDFTRFSNFEKTLHYQFPGLMSAPEMSRQPGGPETVKLYEDYRAYLRGLDSGRCPAIAPKPRPTAAASRPVGATTAMPAPAAIPPGPAVSLTLIPPSPVTDQIAVDVRAAVWNRGEESTRYEMSVYMDQEKPQNLLHCETVAAAARSPAGIGFRWLAKGHAGKHQLLFVARSGDRIQRAAQPLAVLPSTIRSTRRIDGAWCSFNLPEMAEGRIYDPVLRQMTDAQWQELVRGMHAVGMDIIVIQESVHYHRHNCDGKPRYARDDYGAKAFYPSQLFAGRMPMRAADPIRAILAEADKLGMHVLVGVGLFAWFDYTPASLAWHERLADELWQRYGRHPSFYGWYVSEEKNGSLGNAAEQGQIVAFFKEFTPYVHRLAPDKPVMLAPNCYHLRGADDVYRRLLPHVDILCPFAFQRMPPGDQNGRQAAALLQTWCDHAGCHLWLDMEVFLFERGGALIPRPIAGVLDDLQRYPNFEKIICYQYPGLMTSPDASLQPGGDAAVKLYRDYQKYLDTLSEREIARQKGN
jgi:hypothetical protein